MEIVEIIKELVGNYAFPIAACVALFIQNNRQAEQHKSEMDKVTEALNNNTRAIEQLINSSGR